MPALHAYREGMQYTLRNLPPQVDAAIRDQGRREQRSINDVALEALQRAFGLTPQVGPRRDLSQLYGRQVDDPAVDQALDHQRQVDPDLWA